jgi:homogentisate phytyltransferase/homogentisate geranylgeranyltransferase
MKDVPDTAGDSGVGNYETYAIRRGRGPVFSGSALFLTSSIALFAAGFGAAAARDAARGAMGAAARRGACCAVGFASRGWILREVREVDSADSGGVYDFYMKLWKVFYVSYLVVPFAW